VSGCIGYFPSASTQVKAKATGTKNGCEWIGFSLLFKPVPQARIKICGEWQIKDPNPKIGLNLKLL